jgi:hypothetical protein
MNQVKLRLPLWRQHRTRVDASSPGPEHPAATAEDGAERGLGNGRYLTDKLELIILQPYAYAGIELGQHLERLGSEKLPLISCRDIQQLTALLSATTRCAGTRPVRPSIRPSVRLYSRLTHQLVGGDAHREGKSQSLARLLPDTGSDVLWRTEESAGAGEIEERMPVTTRLYGGGKDPQDLVQRARSASIQPGVGWQNDEVGTEPLGLSYRHSPYQPCPPGLG